MQETLRPTDRHVPPPAPYLAKGARPWLGLGLSGGALASLFAVGCGSSSSGGVADASHLDVTTSPEATLPILDGGGRPRHGDARADAGGTTDGGKDGRGGGHASSNDGASDGPSDARSGKPDAGMAPTCDASAGPGDRVITLTNECPGQTIHVGINGGYVEDCNAGTCPAGTTCNTTRSPPGCFWDFPAPSCGSDVLGAGASVTYVLTAAPITAPGQTSSIKWSGNVYAGSQCATDGTACKTAECATSVGGQTVVGSCADGVGPQGPVTLAELTLVPGGSDFYDISSINGVNVPVSMAPIGGAPDATNPYTCAAAGAVTPSSRLAACSWSFDPSISLGDESAVLRAVVPGGAACTSDADCTGSDVCGTALAFGSSAPTQSCGEQVAWWTADELCVYTGNAYGAPIDCSQAVAGQGTNASLYGCTGAANGGSCYSTGAGSTCCGCPDWDIDGQSLTVPAGFSCDNNNSSWQSVAEPWAAFVKDACPTAYSFPFDDATSTFTCTTPNPSASNPNSVGYTITFCPGGVTGI
jgi:hypothetical protein